MGSVIFSLTSPVLCVIFMGTLYHRSTSLSTQSGQYFLWKIFGAMTLRDLLISKGIKRPIDFARKTGLSRQYAHALWSGDRLVSRKMARRLAPILDVSPEMLVMLERPTT
jgi:Cro/C1-type HTH DNA-binding domain